MSVEFFCGVKSLLFPSQFKRIKFLEFFLTSNQEHLPSKLKEGSFKEHLGGRNLQSINENAFFLKNFETQPKEPELEFHRFESLCNAIISSLWFVKDNCAHISISYYYDENRDSKLFKLTSNERLTSKSDGTFKAEGFSQKEMEEGLEYQTKIAEIRKEFYYKYDGIVEATTEVENVIKQEYINTNDSNRISRALRFLSETRTIHYLPFKISLYITVFECLFTTVNTEVTHRVSERVSFYLGGSPEEKQKNYKTIKSAYDLRSRYFHGDQLESKHNTHEKQTYLATAVDDLLRRVFRKIILEDYKKFLDDKNLEGWFTEILFNSGTERPTLSLNN